MIIRPLASQDRDKIHRLVSQKGVFKAEEIQVALELVDEALLHPKKGDYLIHCALEAGGELAGYMCFGPIPMTEYSYDLYWIAVDDRFSRRGIAGELLRFMEREVMQRRGRHIYVETSSTPAYEPARTFYEKHHYKLMCILEDFYRPGDHKMILRKDV